MDDLPRRPAPLAHTMYDALADLVGKPVLATVDPGRSGGLSCVIRARLHRVRTADQHAHLLFGPGEQETRVIVHTPMLTSVSTGHDDDRKLTVTSADTDLTVEDLSPQARVAVWQRTIREAWRLPDEQARAANLRLIAAMVAAEIDASSDAQLKLALRAVLAAIGMLGDLHETPADAVVDPWPPEAQSGDVGDEGGVQEDDGWYDDELDDDDARPWDSWPPEP